MLSSRKFRQLHCGQKTVAATRIRPCADVRAVSLSRRQIIFFSPLRSPMACLERARAPSSVVFSGPEKERERDIYIYERERRAHGEGERL